MSSEYVKKTLSLLIALIMVLGSFTSIASAETDNIISARVDVYEEAMAKIDEDVMNELEENEFVEVLVYMKDQADTEMIARATRLAVEDTMTPYRTKLEVRRGVVEALKDTAETTQGKLIKYLKQEEERGNVLEYKPYHIVNMIYVKGTREVIENIALQAEVGKIHKNNTYYIEFLKADGEKTELGNTEPEWNITRIGADQVWNLGFDGTGVVVGQLDTGVDWTHPALKNKWRGYNPVTDEIDSSKSWFDPVYGDSLPKDLDGHGTHVMGTAVGSEPDGSNPIGVAPGARWIAARVFDATGRTTDKILLDAAEWMLHPGGDPNAAPDVVNNSWGGLDGIDDWYRDAVRAWRAAGIFPVFSAGNQRPGEPEPWPGSISVPANYPESFAVAAVDRNDRRASFSKLGPSPYDETLVKPEISAPGVNIYSCIPGGYTDGYSGTSMAAPHITGTIALMLSANASLTIDEIEQILTETADPLTDNDYPTSPNYGYGYGMVNAYEAVLRVAPGTGIIKGKVLVEGEDIEDAEIYHEQSIFEAYPGSNIDIFAEVSDDVAVREVELLVKQPGKTYWILIPMERISGNHKSGTYKGTITADLLIGDSILYRIRARDYAGEAVLSDDYSIDIVFGIVPGDYFEGFEEYPVGWIFEGSWEWGVPFRDDPDPFEGEKLAGTVLGGMYPNNANDWLITPPIDLRDTSLRDATLRFYEWYDLQNNLDEGFVLVTNDFGESWTRVGPVRTGEGRRWRESIVDLKGYIGSQNPVYVAFNLSTSPSVQSIGWYIDNVRLIEVDTEAPSAPMNLTGESTLTAVKLVWDPVDDADLAHYAVYRSLTSGEGYELIGEPVDNRFKDVDIEPGTTYYYRVAAVDDSGNVSEFSNEISITTVETTVIFGTDFEEDDGGFVKGVVSGTENPWEWGIPTSGPMEAASGEKLWATNLSGSYTNSTDAYIESPAIYLPADKESVLTFTHWVDMEGTSTLYDYGQVLISSDNGATWTNITPVNGGKYGSRIQAWSDEEISLSAYKGQEIKLRFFFHSDISVQLDGWYIDDVCIVGLDNEQGYLHQSMRGEWLDPVGEEDEEHSISPITGRHKLTGNESNSYEIVEDAEIQGISMYGTGITADEAYVTILETGRSVKVDPVTGKFTMIVPAGEYTLVAEAYGYYPEEVSIAVNEGDVITQDFMLAPRPRGTITGRVVDRYYSDPASYAEIRIAEDPKVGITYADADGYFTIPNVIAGTYTLKVIAEGFDPGEFKDIVVNADDTTVVQLGLRRFVGFEDEIAYDDGTDENALVLNEPKDGLAVRFTPSEYCKVTKANVYLRGEDFPVPGGNRLGFTIYGTDKYGNPYMVGEPIFVDNLVRGAWNIIDLSSFNFYTDRDFYISTIQDRVGWECPAVGVDLYSTGTRSYMNFNGELYLMSTQGASGGLMIRAIVERSLPTPVITNLDEENYTNQDSIVLEGRVAEVDSKVNIYINGELAETTYSEGLAFEVEIDLPQDENIIMITSEINGRETEPSPVIRVIKDKVQPVLTVDEPVDNLKVNEEVINVTGNASDNRGLARVLINGMEAFVDANGDFNERIFVNPGENTVTVQAVDLAGNVTTVERTVMVNLDGTEITNMTPSEDVTYYQGDTVEVSFTAEPGGQGYFRILLDISPQGTTGISIPMTEAEPGLYIGTWDIPEGFAIKNGVVEFEFIDPFGNEKVALAPGRVTIFGISMDKLPVNAVIVGDEAFDIEFLNNDSNAQIKLISWNGPIYIKLGSNVIVNLNGELVDSDEALPGLLTYYSREGYPMIYEKLNQ